MTLFEFKKKVLEKDLNGVYILSGPESFLKKQYVDRITEDYNLVKVKTFDELTRKIGKKSLTGAKTNNLLLYIESIKDIDMKTLHFEGTGVIIIVTLDDTGDNIIYFDKLNEEILKKYTTSPLLKYRSQIEIVQNALKILNKGEEDIVSMGLVENKFVEPTPEEYASAIIIGDRRTLVRYNFILQQLESSPYMYISALYDMLSIYHLFLEHKNVFEGTNAAYSIGLNYTYAKTLRDKFCRPKTEAEKAQGYGNWKTLRNLIEINCINKRKEVLDILLNNYMYYDADVIFNYLTFCL